MGLGTFIGGLFPRKIEVIRLRDGGNNTEARTGKKTPLRNLSNNQGFIVRNKDTVYVKMGDVADKRVSKTVCLKYLVNEQQAVFIVLDSTSRVTPLLDSVMLCITTSGGKDVSPG